MTRVMVRYKVKPERAAENEALVRAVYDELAATQPAGLRYATFKLEDGLSFIHLAELEEQVELASVAAFRRFRQGLEERCDEPPVRVVLSKIGSFGP
jgi:hypothetical protein